MQTGDYIIDIERVVQCMALFFVLLENVFPISDKKYPKDVTRCDNNVVVYGKVLRRRNEQ